MQDNSELLINATVKALYSFKVLFTDIYGPVPSPLSLFAIKSDCTDLFIMGYASVVSDNDLT